MQMASRVVPDSAQLPLPRLRADVAAGQASPLGTRTSWRPAPLSCYLVAGKRTSTAPRAEAIPPPPPPEELPFPDGRGAGNFARRLFRAFLAWRRRGTWVGFPSEA